MRKFTCKFCCVTMGLNLIVKVDRLPNKHIDYRQLNWTKLSSLHRSNIELPESADDIAVIVDKRSYMVRC